MKKGGIVKNSQIDMITASDLERPKTSSDKYDSTLEERERTYESRKPEPRFNEYR